MSNNSPIEIKITKHYTGVEMTILEMINAVNKKELKSTTLFIMKGFQPKVYKDNQNFLNRFRGISPTPKVLVLTPEKKPPIITAGQTPQELRN